MPTKRTAVTRSDTPPNDNLPAYNAVAAWYDAWVNDLSAAGNAAVLPFLDLVGDARDQQVCDIACGQGRIARALAERGALVVGVDIATALLGIAREAEQRNQQGIVYQRDDAQALRSLADDSFDGATCFLALMDIEDVEAALQSAWRVLKPGGWFTFAITHPCFEAPHARFQHTETGAIREISAYFDEGFWRSGNPNGVRGKVGAHHRMLATYINAVIATGFQLDALREPQLSAAAIAREPGYGIVPSILLVACHKPSATQKR